LLHAHRICFLYPDKYVAVAYIKEGISNVSLRGKNIKKILEKLLERFEGASGGGHEEAAGARVKSSDLARFREELEREVNER